VLELITSGTAPSLGVTQVFPAAADGDNDVTGDDVTGWMGSARTGAVLVVEPTEGESDLVTVSGDLEELSC